LDEQAILAQWRIFITQEPPPDAGEADHKLKFWGLSMCSWLNYHFVDKKTKQERRQL
jgi:hypothetical protein